MPDGVGPQTEGKQTTVIADIEQCFSAGWSDGLPVVPPYRYLVDQMLEAMGWEAGQVVGEFEAERLEIRADHVAAAAVMSGCLPEYAPVLRAAADSLLDPEFNLVGVEVTTGGVSVLTIVSGPIVEKLGFHHGANAIGGSNVRVNATIGRFGNMLRYFAGRVGGALEAHGTMGHPGRLGFLIAERPNGHWPAFHTQNGLPEDVSAVSVMSSEGPNSVNNHYGNKPEGVLDTIADCLAHAGTTNFYYRIGVYVVVVGPQHADVVAPAYSREEARSYLFDHARRPTDDLIRMGRIHPDRQDDYEVEPGTMRSPFFRESQMFLLEAGATGGNFSAVIPGWAGCMQIMTKKIEE